MLRASRLPKTRIPSDLSFGIEYEFNHLAGDHDDYSAQDVVRRMLQQREMPNWSGWNVVHDGSCGLELVSPVLKGEEGLKQARVGLDVLRALGARTDRRCGLHVHFSTPNMRRYLRSLTKALMYAEPLFLAATTANRYGNMYCRLWERRHLNVVNGTFNNSADSWYGRSLESEPCDCGDDDCEEYLTQENDGRDDKYHDSRYSAINLHSFFYGTGIELRYFHVPRTSERLEAWLRTIAAVDEFARTRTIKHRVLPRLGANRYALDHKRVKRMLRLMTTRRDGDALSVESTDSAGFPAIAA